MLAVCRLNIAISIVSPFRIYIYIEDWWIHYIDIIDISMFFFPFCIAAPLKCPLRVTCLLVSIRNPQFLGFPPTQRSDKHTLNTMMSLLILRSIRMYLHNTSREFHEHIHTNINFKRDFFTIYFHGRYHTSWFLHFFGFESIHID